MGFLPITDSSSYSNFNKYYRQLHPKVYLRIPTGQATEALICTDNVSACLPFDSSALRCCQADEIHGKRSQGMACSANHSKGSGGTSAVGAGLILGQPAWLQRKIHLRPQHRGVHLVTEEILRQLPELSQFSVGLMHIQLLHTSASLAINENWDPDVRDDMEMMLNRLVPEDVPFRHSCEGPDDMPAHVKACLLGSNLTVPVSDGKLNLGTWQGVWLCEHRDRAGSRKVLVTVNGALRDPERTSLSPNSPNLSTSS